MKKLKLSPREKLMGIHALVWAMVVPIVAWLPSLIGLETALVIIGCLFFVMSWVSIAFAPRGGASVSDSAAERVAAKWQCSLQEAEHKIEETMCLLALDRDNAVEFLDEVRLEIGRKKRLSIGDLCGLFVTLLLVGLMALTARAGEKELPPPDPRPQFTVCEILMGIAITILGFAAICAVKRAANHIPTPPPPPPPSDRDGDGFFDSNDRCPDEAGTANGCPDYDGDGVDDYHDDCPLEFGKPPTGCPTNPTNPPPRMSFTNSGPRIVSMGTMMVDTISLTSTGWTDASGDPYLEQMDFGFDTSTNLINWQEAATVTLWLSRSNRLAVWKVNGVPISTNYAPRVAGINMIGALPAMPGPQRFFRQAAQ